ncbi:MAG: HAD-IA family hydrolase [SAR324 cluster bacterium]|nr:HAD-IA family hydrolase [SAR324 cluster bacterium]
MIKAVLWDFGGVVTSSPFDAFNRFEVENSIPKDFIRGVNATNPRTNAWAQFESNQISIEVFDRLFEAESKAAGFAIKGHKVLLLLAGDVRPEMVAALKTCKAHLKIGCITNNVKADKETVIPQTTEKQAQVSEIMQLFDEVIESSIEGVRKPEPEIYQIALERMDVKAEECIFLDDLGINLKPAKAMGMKTIKVLNARQALEELQQYTGLNLL